MVEVGLSGTHRNTSKSKLLMFLLACVFYIICCVEWVWWKHILLKICAFVHCVWKNNGYADQQHNSLTQTQNKTNNIRTTVTLCCGCVTLMDVKKKTIIFIYSECVSVAYLTSMRNACSLLCYYVCRFSTYRIIPHYLTNGKIFRKDIIKLKIPF